MISKGFFAYVGTKLGTLQYWISILLSIAANPLNSRSHTIPALIKISVIILLPFGVMA